MDRKSGKKTLLYVLVSVVIVLIALILFFLFKPNNNTNNSSDNSATPTPTETSAPTPTPTPSTDTTDTPTTTVTVTPTTSATPIPSGGTLSEAIKVKVPYSVDKDPNDPTAKNSMDSFGYYAYRIFSTTRADTENFVMEKMIAGPSDQDKTDYFWFTPITLSGDSNCGGADFQITKDTSANKITVKFCKTVQTAGVGDDARITTVIKAGMEQFLSEDSTKTVVVLTKDGNCFGDGSGTNQCLN